MSNGVFVWFDYMASDVDKAIAFYGETTGWKAQPFGDQGYQMFMLTEQEAVGGVMQLPPDVASMGVPPHWMAYISCEDADAICVQAQELGGKVLREPFDIPTVGRIAVLQDPQGAAFSVIALEDDMTPPDPATPGAFSWSELMTTDWKAGLDFYSDLFGWKTGDSMDMGDEGTYQLFETEGAMHGGMMNMPEGVPVPHWLYYVTTDDLDASQARIEQNGGNLIVGPMDVPGGRVSAFNDNQGGGFALYERTGE